MLLFDLDQPYKIVIDKFVIIHDQKMKMIFHTFDHTNHYQLLNECV